MFESIGRLLSSYRRRPARPSAKPRTHLMLEQLEDRVTPTAVTVTTLTDDPNGPIPGNTTLRDAIKKTNGSGDANNSITFNAGLIGGWLYLQKALDPIQKNVTIAGPGGQESINIDGNATAQNPYSIFVVQKGVTATLSGFLIEGGYLSLGNGGAGVQNSGTLTLTNDLIEYNHADNGFGGGINNAPGATMTMSGTDVDNNTAGAGGGGISNNGTLTMSGRNVSGNTTPGMGGGIFNASGATLTMLGSVTIQDNSASLRGGGIYNEGNVKMIGGTIYNNQSPSGQGGGLFNYAGGNVTLSGSVTVSSNTGNQGGGLYLQVGSTTVLTNVTIKGNKLAGNNSNGTGIYQQTVNKVPAKLIETQVTDPDDPNGPFQGP